VLTQDLVLDRVFHALADSSRRHIVEQLERGPASVSELAEPLPMTLAAVVQHVQVLEAAGIVRTQKVGRVRRCEVDVEALRPVDRWIADRRAGWHQAFDRLGAVLAEPEPEPRPTPEPEPDDDRSPT
jgi:DNA-binding transcriptional ArsR family regulator